MRPLQKYTQNSQISKMEPFAKIVNRFIWLVNSFIWIVNSFIWLVNSFIWLTIFSKR